MWSRRCATRPSPTTTSCSPGCSTTPARAAPGCGRAWRLARPGVRRVGLARRPASCPACARRIERLRTHAETSARARGTGRGHATDRRADPAPGRAGRSGRGPTSPARGRGELMLDAGTVRAPSVVFGEGRRPEASTRVAVAEFEGPLALLLALIEARELDVLTVPLGALADAYLDALATLDVDRLGNVSSFVAVASQLILIKSRAMLPRQAPAGAGRPGRRGARPRGRAARPPAALPRLPRRRREPGRRGAAPGRPLPARARHGPCHRRSRAPGRPTPSALADAAGPRARRPGPYRAAPRAAARDHCAHDHPDRAGGDHPRRPARRADGRPPGPAARASAIGSSSRSRSSRCSS